jgi:GT2 family glycosyltransferase
MITLNDFSFLIVSAVNDVDRLRGVYQSIRSTYPKNEIVIIYENISNISMSDHDDNLIEVRTNERVYVSGGYNLALKHCTKKCFVFLHDDTFLAKNFLENIVPHISETQFCNFTTVEPPLYNDPNTFEKPIMDFGRSMDVFSLDKFNKFCEEHIKKIPSPVVDSPFGGFFMAGYKSSIDTVQGFDEYFQPYFYEDGDLMIRLHQAGYKFVHVLNSIVYHMGSMTSRVGQEGIDSTKTTRSLYIKKWKVPWEYMREYTLANGIPYKKIPVEIKVTNATTQLLEFTDLINEPGSSMTVEFDARSLNQEDYAYLQTLPYILQSIEEQGDYQIGNLIIKYTINEKNSNF